MKKTLAILLAALAMGMASAVSADTLSASPDVSATATTGNYSKYGFTLDFGKSAKFMDGEEKVELSSYSDFQLTSISITTTTTGITGAKLAVYKIADTSPDGTSWSGSGEWAYDPGIKNFESYVGVSSAGFLEGTLGTFTFDTPLSLDPTAWYAFIFVGANVAESNYSTGSNLGTAATANGTRYGKVTFLAYDSSSTSGLAYGDMLNAGSGASWNNTQTAAATYTFTATKAVPEPATATLSLLALAGLAARRRRK